VAATASEGAAAEADDKSPIAKRSERRRNIAPDKIATVKKMTSPLDKRIAKAKRKCPRPKSKSASGDSTDKWRVLAPAAEARTALSRRA
jgi:hypothetical protein